MLLKRFAQPARMGVGRIPSLVKVTLSLSSFSDARRYVDTPPVGRLYYFECGSSSHR